MNSVIDVLWGGLCREYVRTRVRYTYLYLAGSLGVTAVVARSLFHSGFALRMMSANPWLVFGATFVGLMGAQVAVRSIPYEVCISIWPLTITGPDPLRCVEYDS